MIKGIDKTKESINNSINNLQEEKEEISIDDIKDIIVDLRKNWDNLDISSRNSFINQFIKYIDLDVYDGKANIKEIQFI